MRIRRFICLGLGFVIFTLYGGQSPSQAGEVYYMKRVVVEKDKKGNTEKTGTDHALVTYSAAKPQVVCVDEEKRPLEPPRWFGPIFQLMPYTTLSLAEKIPDFEEIEGTPWPAYILANSFDIIPLKPAGDLEAGRKWQTPINLIYGIAEETEISTQIFHVAKEKLVERKGHTCVEIEYTLAGNFKSEDYPERFDEKQLSKERLGYSVQLQGTAYVDIASGMLVDKSQTLSVVHSYKGLLKSPDGGVGWVAVTEDERSVTISVSLEQP